MYIYNGLMFGIKLASAGQHKNSYNSVTVIDNKIKPCVVIVEIEPNLYSRCIKYLSKILACKMTGDMQSFKQG